MNDDDSADECVEEMVEQWILDVKDACGITTPEEEEQRRKDLTKRAIKFLLPNS